MPRKPRNPGTGKAPVNTPASRTRGPGTLTAQGAGYGGQANGTYTKMSAERQPTPEAIRQGIRDAAAAREFLAPHVQPILEHWTKIATHDTVNGMKAGENVVDRVLGKIPQHVTADVASRTSTVPDLSGLSDDEVRKGTELFRELRQIEARAHAGRQHSGADAGSVLPAGLVDVVRDGA